MTKSRETGLWSLQSWICAADSPPLPCGDTCAGRWPFLKTESLRCFAGDCDLTSKSTHPDCLLSLSPDIDLAIMDAMFRSYNLHVSSAVSPSVSANSTRNDAVAEGIHSFGAVSTLDPSSISGKVTLYGLAV